LEAAGHANQQAAAVGSGFQQRHPAAGIFGQAIVGIHTQPALPPLTIT